MPVVDVIWADRYGREVGYIGKVAGDFAIGRENTFSLVVSSDVPVEQGCYVMIDGTEYGGMVDGVEIDTTADFVTVSGRTWHGLLATQLIVPDPGQLHHSESGDCNAVLGRLVERTGLSGVMAAERAPSGFEVSGWRFSRASAEMDAYTGIRAMLRSVGAKLAVRYDSAARRAVLSAVPRGDYTSDGLDGERVGFVLRTTRPVNHLHCLGIGEGLARTVVDLYADDRGNVSRTQTIFGAAHKGETYENSSSDAADLESDGRKRLADLQEGMSSCALAGADDGRYDIDDIVGGTSVEHGQRVVTYVAEKIATVTSRAITYETKTALEAR
ncbi:MAG: hypothetical protein HFJ67_10285 [Adlercreutzia mucosicola]|nr:hypothetical protein [Adlercreutzia mucosicola]